MPKAVLVFRDKQTLADGTIIEMRIWRVPEPVAPSRHAFKYSLFYGREGVRLIGYDNERGKGDHRHRGGTEEAYRFTTVENLIADFLADIDALKGL